VSKHAQNGVRPCITKSIFDQENGLLKGESNLARLKLALTEFGLERRKAEAPAFIAAYDERYGGITKVADTIVEDEGALTHPTAYEKEHRTTIYKLTPFDP
jgi:hypothetical protein